MHVRRRFRLAQKTGHLHAAFAVDLIRRIYRIETQAADAGLDAEARAALRRKEALPLLQQFDDWVDQQVLLLRPSDPVRKAAKYAQAQRPYIRRCFSDGRFELDNGRTERAIKEVAIGRKNFLFAGSFQGAERLAAAYTLVQSCRRIGMPARPYLIDVIEKVAGGWPARRIVELTPDTWAAEHPDLVTLKQIHQ